MAPDDVHVLAEVSTRSALGEPRAAVGRQHVVHAGDVVAERGRRPRTEEHRARVADAAGRSVSGSAVSSSRCSGAIAFTAVDRGDRVVDQHDAAPRRERRRDLVATVRVGDEPLERVVGRVGHVGVPGDQDRGAAGTVLGLGEEVGGDELGGDRAVGDDHDLRRARRTTRCRRVPATSRLASATYRLPGPTITSTGRIDSVPYASAAIACAPPTRYTSSTPASAAAASVGCGTRPSAAGRHAQHELGDARDLRGDRGHQHGRRVRGASAGHVEPGAVDRDRELAERHAVAIERGLGRVGLERVVRADAVGGDAPARPASSRRRPLSSAAAQLAGGDPRVVDVAAVERGGQLPHGGVAAACGRRR